MKYSMMNKWSRLVLLAPLAAGCSKENPPAEQIVESTEVLEEDLQQPIRVIHLEEGPDGEVIRTPGEYEFFEIDRHIAHGPCAAELRKDGESSYLCKARLYMEAAGVRDQPVFLKATSFNTESYTDVEIPTQDIFSRVTLAEGAFRNASFALGELSGAIVNEVNDDAEYEESTRQRIGGYLEASTLVREAMDLAVSTKLSAGDAARTSTAISENVLQTAQYRRRAARNLLPDTHHRTNTTPESCTARAPEGSVERALRVLRNTAVSPVDVLNLDLGIDAFLNGETNVEGGGSVRERALLLDYPVAGTIQDHFEISTDDFVAAREYLAQELRIYSRSLTASVTLENGLKWFGATATEPDMPGVYWLARERNTWGYPAPDYSPYAGNVIESQYLGAAGALDALRTTNIAHRDVARNVFSSVLAQREDQGYYYLCGGENRRLPFLLGFEESEDMLLLRGDDGLRCATTGGIEGVTCSAEDLASYVITGFEKGDLEEGYEGLDHFFGATADQMALLYSTKWDATTQAEEIPFVDDERFYLVRRRTGVTEAVPGAYEPVTGVSNKCEGMYFPEYEQRAAEILQPDPEWCSVPRVSCAGLEWSERIPLEDELSSDGDDVESSWRHYLTLAQQAAQESDELAKEYLQSGLEFSLREETIELREEDRERIAHDRASQAVEELQEICGSEIDPDRLLGLLRGQEDELSFLEPDTTCSDETPCSDGFDCIVGRCVRNIDALLDDNKDIYPELNKIRACIADEQDSFVHLAQTDDRRVLCIWHDENDPNRICEDMESAGSCPVAIIGTAGQDPDISCTAATEPPAGHVAKAVTVGLGLVEADVNRVLSLPTAGLECDALRFLRGQQGAPSILDKIGYGDRLDFRLFMDPDRVKDAAKKLQFNWTTGDNGEVKFGNQSVARISDDVNRLPCFTEFNSDDEPYGGCTEGGTGLFCLRSPCDDSDTRGVLNRRFLRAVQAAQAMAGVRSKTMSLPVAIPEQISTERVSFSATGEQGSGPLIYSNTLAGNVWRPSGISLGSYSPGGSMTFWNGVEWEEVTSTFPDWVVGRFFAAGGGPRNSVGQTTYRNLGPEAGTDWLLGFGPVTLNYSGGGELLDGMSRNDSNIGPLARYLRGELGIAALRRPDDMIRVTPSYDWDHIGESVLDGLELLCEVRAEQAGRDELIGNCGAEVPEVKTLDDLEKVEAFLSCLANDIRRTTETIVLAKFPEEAKDPHRESSLIGSFPALAGLSGADMSELRGSLVQLREAPRRVADSMQDYSDAMLSLRTAVETHSTTNEIEQIELESTIQNQLTSCSVAMSPTISAGVQLGLAPSANVGISFNPGAAIATCSNSLSQINFASEAAQLREQLSNVQLEEAFGAFESAIEGVARDLQRHSDAFVGAVETVDRQLALVALQKSRARRALAKTVHVNSFESRYETQVSAEYLSRFQASRVRYERAHIAAQKMAFLAKRSIETRIGESLANMTEEMPLVEAPSTWEASVCATSPVDYSTLGDGQGAYADQFIGDYVDKLAAVVESYRLTNNFHEGTDTAVVSLRDDLFNIRRVCDVESRNLLFHSTDLDVGPIESVPGWDRVGCDPGSPEVPLGECVEATRLATSIPGSQSLGEPGEAFAVQFGDGSDCASPSCGYQTEPYLGVTTGSVLAQALVLQPGVYRLSWFMSEDTADAESMFAAALPRTEDGLGGAGAVSAATDLLSAPAGQDEARGGFVRFYTLFELQEEREVLVGFQAPSGSVDRLIEVSAPMLEAYDGPTPDGEVLPPPKFEPTGESRVVPLAICADDSGELMRDRQWEWDSDYLCDDGFEGGCSEEGGVREFFWGTRFSVSQEALQKGQLFAGSGFAKGSFNYRIESVALNFVGSGIRDCTDSETPQTCFASGFVPYSLYHQGPYFVRNYDGDDFEAHLFPGRVEWARGLAAERYLGNPVSSADSELLHPYLRSELRGRPLDGEFSIRVWDTGEVQFERIEDVQLIINYRYWTRFE